MPARLSARWLTALTDPRLSLLPTQLRASPLRDATTEAHLEKVEQLPDWHTFGERSMPPAVHALLCGPQPLSNKHVPGQPLLKREMHGIDSDAMRTAAVVLYVVRWHDGPRDALRASIDLGGDVDSIAALALGLVGGSAGLQFGEDAGLPWELLEGLEGAEYLASVARRFSAWVGAQ